MKRRMLTLLVLVVALMLSLTTTVSAQNDNPTVCFNLSQADCDILEAAVANTSANLTSLHANYTLNYVESNQVFVIGVNDVNVAIEGDITSAIDTAMLTTDPTKATSVQLKYTASGNLGPYGVTGGQSIAYVDGVSYWTDPLSGRWVGISTNDALMLGLGAASVGAASMQGIPGMEMVRPLLDPSVWGGDPAALLAPYLNPQALISDPSSMLAGLGLGLMPPVFYASMERLADTEMAGQTMHGFALTLDLSPDLVASALGGLATMVPAEVWDDISATATLTRWYGADDQLQHGLSVTVDVTVGSTARTHLVSLVAPNAVPAGAMLAPASVSLDFNAEFDRLNEMFEITAPEGATMITLDMIMGMMGMMTGGQ